MKHAALSLKIAAALAIAVLLAAPFVGAAFQPLGPLILCAACAVSAIFAIIRKTGSGHPLRSLPAVAVALGVLIAFVSIFVSVNKGASLEAFVLAAGLAALWYAVSKGARTQGTRFLAAAVIIAASGVALWGVREYLMTWATYAEAGKQWRVFSSFINPNSLSGYLALTAPLILGVLMTARRKALVWACAVGFWAQLGALALTGSRFGTLSGLAAIGLFALAYLAISKTTVRRLKRGVAVAVIGLAVLAACSGPLLRRETASHAPPAASVSQAERRPAEDSAGGIASKIRDPFREHVWASTARMWLAHPLLGTGVGTFEYIYPAYAAVGYTAAAHNGYLQALSEMGSLWILVFCLWIAAVGGAAVGALRKGGDDGVLRLGAAAGLVGSALHSVYDYDWQIWAIPATICAVVVIALGPHGEPEQTSPGAPRVQRALRPAAIIGAIALALVAIVLATSHRYVAAARSPDLANDERIAAYRRAVRLNPLNGEFKRELGEFLAELSWYRDDPALAEEGIALMRKGCAQTPTDAVGWYRLGRVLDDEQRTEDAVVAFGKAIEHSKVGTPALLDLADIYLYRDDLDTAEELYTKVVEIEKGPVGRYPAVAGSVNPDYIAAHVGLGEIFLLRGEYGPAALHNTDALKVFRGHQLWMLGLGGGLLAVKPRSQEELEAYLSASHASSSLATIYDEKGKPERGDAWSLCTDVLAIFAEAEDAALNGDRGRAEQALWDVVATAESVSDTEPLALSVAYRAAARALGKLAFLAPNDERGILQLKSEEFQRLAAEADSRAE